MPFATGVLLVLGASVVLLLLVALGCWVVEATFRRVIDPWAVRVAQGEHNRFRDRILRDAWWFSEDAPTMQLLQDVADGRYDVSEIRERWRSLRVAQPQEDTPR